MGCGNPFSSKVLIYHSVSCLPRSVIWKRQVVRKKFLGTVGAPEAAETENIDWTFLQHSSENAFHRVTSLKNKTEPLEGKVTFFQTLNVYKV